MSEPSNTRSCPARMLPRVAALEVRHDRPDRDRRDRSSPGAGGGLGLRRDPRARPRRRRELPGQVRRLDDVAIHERHPAEAGPHRRLGRGRADGADTHERDRELTDASPDRPRRSRERGSNGSTSRAPGSTGGLQQRARVLERRLRDLLAGEHARDLLDPFLPSRSRTEATVRPRDGPLLGKELAVASAAICGTWVTQRTWSCSASPRSFAPRPPPRGRRCPHPPRRTRACGRVPSARRQPTESRAGGAKAPRPKRSSRAVSPAPPDWGRRERRRSRGRWRGARRPGGSRARPAALPSRAPARGAPSRPPRRNGRRPPRAGPSVPPRLRRTPSSPPPPRAGGGPVRPRCGRAPRAPPPSPRGGGVRSADRAAVLSLQPRDLLQARLDRGQPVRIGLDRLGRVAGRSRQIRDPPLEVFGLLPVDHLPRVDRRELGEGPAASPSRSAAEPSSSESAASAVTPARRIRSACRSRSRSAGSPPPRSRPGRRTRCPGSETRASRGAGPRSRREPPGRAEPLPRLVPAGRGLSHGLPLRLGLRKGVQELEGGTASTSSCSELWPWIASSRSPRRASVRTDAGSSSTNARPRPSRESSRRRECARIRQPRLRQQRAHASPHRTHRKRSDARRPRG